MHDFSKMTIREVGDLIQNASVAFGLKRKTIMRVLLDYRLPIEDFLDDVHGRLSKVSKSISPIINWNSTPPNADPIEEFLDPPPVSVPNALPPSIRATDGHVRQRRRWKSVVDSEGKYFQA